MGSTGWRAEAGFPASPLPSVRPQSSDSACLCLQRGSLTESPEECSGGPKRGTHLSADVEGQWGCRGGQFPPRSGSPGAIPGPSRGPPGPWPRTSGGAAAVDGGLRGTGGRAGARLSCAHSVCWRALWAGLCPALLLCQQRDLQPHRWLLPVLPWMDWQGLFTG